MVVLFGWFFSSKRLKFLRGGFGLFITHTFSLLYIWGTKKLVENNREKVKLFNCEKLYEIILILGTEILTLWKKNALNAAVMFNQYGVVMKMADT